MVLNSAPLSWISLCEQDRGSFRQGKQDSSCSTCCGSSCAVAAITYVTWVVMLPKSLSLLMLLLMLLCHRQRRHGFILVWVQLPWLQKSVWCAASLHAHTENLFSLNFSSLLHSVHTYLHIKGFLCDIYPCLTLFFCYAGWFQPCPTSWSFV